MDEGVTAAILTQLAKLPVPDALAALAAAEMLTPAAAAKAAQLALAAAPMQPDQAARWLTLLAAWAPAAGADQGIVASIEYARARVALEAGDFTTAEAALRTAREQWQQIGDNISLARSGLGLSHLLAMQGRQGEAETVIRASVAALSGMPGEDAYLLQLDARQNLATCLSYQERHAEALTMLETVRADYLRLVGASDGSETLDLQIRLGLVERDMALAHTYLDQPQEAEELLITAIERLDLPEANSERGQARTNLGHLYGRTGRYAEAVQQLDAAALDLLGTVDVDSVPERWAAADVLFMEQAGVYLALNLLAEAEAALRKALQILRSTQQPYELGQALYYLGILEWRRGAAEAATGALNEAEGIYVRLDNAYWRHHVQLAQAGIALNSGRLDAAAEQLDLLLADAAASATGSALAWDQASRCELYLLEAQWAVAGGQLQRATEALDSAAAALGLPAADADALVLPYLQIRLLHIAGQVARASGRTEEARRLFERAAQIIETQRGLLPIEELRAAFLSDKSAVYADLLLSLLEEAQPEEAALAAAFDVVERARSRVLLERLLTTFDEAQATAGLAPEVGEQIAEARRRLAWLYNQLLGGPGGAAGSRGITLALSAELRSREETLQRLEWQRSEWLRQVQPATLPQLQAHLEPDQAAVVFFMAGNELLAFIVKRQAVDVVRSIASAAELDAALAQWRFQLGRVEIGGGYAERHATRLLEGALGALLRLHDLLIAPILPHLAEPAGSKGHVQRLLVVPYGALHLVPFHALWDGGQYLLEAFEITYAPSASLAVQRNRSDSGTLRTLAAVAVTDTSIPQAEDEVRAAARHFTRAELFLQEQASCDGIQLAAQAGDVLHISTHGVFRPDNPFFSALKLADGWIDVRAIYRLPLSARLVVLSACESGAVQVKGSDEPIGLGRGFLGAGAHSLVVSLWNVHDASAAILMDEFYANLAADQRRTAAALRAAQRQTAAEGRHPYYWAPYIVIGG